MITIKQVWLAIVALLTSFALLSICAFATGDSNASASSDAMSMDASGNAFIRVNVYKDFNDIYKNLTRVHLSLKHGGEYHMIIGDNIEGF